MIEGRSILFRGVCEYGDVPQGTILFILEIGYLYQYFF